jgi:hypothetical protein
MQVTGVERNGDCWRSSAAVRRRWSGSKADLIDLDLPPASFDAMRTERVLMHSPGWPNAV